MDGRSKRKRSSYRTASKKKTKTGDYQKGRELLGHPKQELKAFDVALTNTAVTAAGAYINSLNVPINGAELYQRVGRKIYMKSIHIRGYLTPNAASAAIQPIRILLFYDSQPNGAAPVAVANLIADSNVAGATTIYSEINLGNRQRFKILRDTQFLMPETTAAGSITNNSLPDACKQSLHIDQFVKLKGLETVFNGVNGGTVADVQSGALGMLVIAGSNGDWTFTWQTRMRYYD